MKKTRPALPPGYSVADADHTPPFHIRLHGVRTDVLDWRDRPEHPSVAEAVAAVHSPVAQAIVKAGVEAEEARARQDTIEGGRGAFASQEEAEAAAWSHWREHAAPEWVAFIEPSDEPVDLREPFTGFPLSDEHREVAEGMAAHFADAFEQANQSAPTTDTVVMGAHLRTFAEKAAEDTGGKTSKLVQAIFNGDTTLSQATSLMLAALVIRMYNAPYGGLNEAGLDFVNVLVAVLDIVSKTTGKSPKFGGVAKGKRPV